MNLLSVFCGLAIGIPLGGALTLGLAISMVEALAWWERRKLTNYIASRGPSNRR